MVIICQFGQLKGEIAFSAVNSDDLVLFLFVDGQTVVFYGDLLMNHYDPYFSSVFYRLVRLPTVVQTLKIGKSKVELIDKNIWLVNM